MFDFFLPSSTLYAEDVGEKNYSWRNLVKNLTWKFSNFQRPKSNSLGSKFSKVQFLDSQISKSSVIKFPNFQQLAHKSPSYASVYYIDYIRSLASVVPDVKKKEEIYH